MLRVVSPPKSELNKLRQPLTAGEKLVFDFFDTNLSPEWEIYIQPHLNGLRPDFVLLNPKVGIAVFEVKDWNFSAMKYEVVKKDSGQPKLLATRDGKTFSRQSDNPIEQINLYKNEIYELYCPRLEQKSGFAVITAGVIFPFADDIFVQNLFRPCLEYRGMLKYPQYNPISGKNALFSNDLVRVFPEAANRFYSSKMNENLYKDLKNWLVEPEFSEAQREPVPLDSIQRNFVTTRTKTGYRRIKGAAGAGKSLVLAARAAELLGQDKKVLVVTYNITLMHYLKDISVRYLQSGRKARTDITWLNFHSWCKRVCNENGFSEEYDQLWIDSNPHEVLTNTLPQLVINILASFSLDDDALYDAVLVDEGQDFLPLWWSALRKICKPNGEMLLVADATQDIYDTAHSWTDEAMRGAGFRGDWSELKTSYRLPQAAMEKAVEFANNFLPQDLVNIPQNKQGSFEFETCNLRWVHLTDTPADQVCCNEILRIITIDTPQITAVAELTFLCTNRKFGLDVVKCLGKKGIRTVHTFHLDDKESRRQKMGFYMGDARVKATTLHSFKGWESRALVIYIDEKLDKKTLALIYTGLTRIKRHNGGSSLTIVSRSKELLDYGKSWPSFESM